MGKKNPANTSESTVTVKCLAEEFGIATTSIRQIIRANGLRAPKTEKSNGEFGPRTKYQWESDSKELQAVRSYIQNAVIAEKMEVPDGAN